MGLQRNKKLRTCISRKGRKGRKGEADGDFNDRMIG